MDGSIYLILIAASSTAGLLCRKQWFGWRGKIHEGIWHSQEVIWSVDTDFYTVIPDNVAAGRLAFDKTAHLYITIGGKASYSKLHELDTPYGKIHRVNDDGSVPKTILSGNLQRTDQRRPPDTPCGVSDTVPLKVWQLIPKAGLSGHLKWDREAATRSTGLLQEETMAGRCTQKDSTTTVNP